MGAMYVSLVERADWMSLQYLAKQRIGMQGECLSQTDICIVKYPCSINDA